MAGIYNGQIICSQATLTKMSVGREAVVVICRMNERLVAYSLLIVPCWRGGSDGKAPISVIEFLSRESQRLISLDGADANGGGGGREGR